MSVRGEKLHVGLHASLAHLDEHRVGRSRQTEESGRSLKPVSILERPENHDLAILLGEGFETLEAGECIVEYTGERIQVKCKIFRF